MKVKSKRYSLDWEMLEEQKKTMEDLVAEIINDPELTELEELVIGQFTVGYDDEENMDTIIKGLVDNKEKLQHIKSFYFGDMDSEECEVSWITQGNYTPIWGAFPNMEELTIKGANALTLGKISHSRLKSLMLINGGLEKAVLAEIRDADLPALETLVIFLGDDNYGANINKEEIEDFGNNAKLPALQGLGLVNSYIQDEIVEAILKTSIAKRCEELNFSYGALTDKGAQVIIEAMAGLSELMQIDIEHHYVSRVMQKKVIAAGNQHGINVVFDDQQEAEVYSGETYYSILLSE
ncbi:hypothetical protein SAMN02745123_00252 [Desulforamulus aeronauticus DSM 10349]|uniref:Uncharacterized protein n=1 Tax=Desulforamulus aeronauticus DSM 10349 TaxID=1121421 RepID=A0A1M6NNY4_9FIRM|nr:hypothetical protein SAMN02745123_00252 [Desulforamulus aeronauticus DSM 10349]